MLAHTYTVVVSKISAEGTWQMCIMPIFTGSGNDTLSLSDFTMNDNLNVCILKKQHILCLLASPVQNKIKNKNYGHEEREPLHTPNQAFM